MDIWIYGYMDVWIYGHRIQNWIFGSEVDIEYKTIYWALKGTANQAWNIWSQVYFGPGAISTRSLLGPGTWGLGGPGTWGPGLGPVDLDPGIRMQGPGPGDPARP